MFTQTLPLAFAAAISELEAAGPEAAFDEDDFFAGALDAALDELAGAAAGALLAAGVDFVEAAGAGVAAAGDEAGAIAESLEADFLFFLVDPLVEALDEDEGAAAAGAFEDPTAAGADVSAAAAFLLFFLLEAEVEAEEVSEPLAAVLLSALAAFLLLLDFVVVLPVAALPDVAADWSLDEESAALFFLLFFFVVVVEVEEL